MKIKLNNQEYLWKSDKVKFESELINLIRMKIIFKYGFTRFNGVEIKNRAVKIIVVQKSLVFNINNPKDHQSLEEYALSCKNQVDLFFSKFNYLILNRTLEGFCIESKGVKGNKINLDRLFNTIENSLIANPKSATPIIYTGMID